MAPRHAAVKTHLLDFLENTTNDIIYLLSAVYLPGLFDGVGLPVRLHLHFRHDPAARRLRNMFKLEWGEPATRKQQISFYTKHEFEDPEKMEIWDYEESEAARKVAEHPPGTLIPARLMLIYSTEYFVEEVSIRLRTSRLVTYTPAALDKRNAGVHWQDVVRRFLALEREPKSYDERQKWTMAAYGEHDTEWAKRSRDPSLLEALRKSEPALCRRAHELAPGCQLSPEEYHYSQEYSCFAGYL